MSRFSLEFCQFVALKMKLKCESEKSRYGITALVLFNSNILYVFDVATAWRFVGLGMEKVLHMSRRI